MRRDCDCLACRAVYKVRVPVYYLGTYPTTKSMAKFTCNGEAISSDPCTLLLPFPVPSIRLRDERGVDLISKRHVGTYLSRYSTCTCVLQRCSDIVASTSSSATPETLSSSFQGLFGRWPEMELVTYATPTQASVVYKN